MSRIIGIDLGTTNSLAAVWQDGKSVLIPNSFGEYLTPSVVSIGEDGTVYVGKTAKERLASHPQDTAGLFKRFMGTSRQYRLGGRTYLPEELSAFVLKKIKEDAEKYLGEPIEEAVISVPAYFNDMARNATKRAGIIAGLKVERIINEPSAAAVACQKFRKEESENEEEDVMMLVFDFGGGTLDVSLVECFDNVIEILAVSGDNRLGGQDFDDMIATHFIQTLGLDFKTMPQEAKAIIRKSAEQCKKELTENAAAEMVVNCQEINKKVTFTRKEIVKICAPLFERMGRPISRVLMDTNTSAMQINQVVLVGGSCKMPVVQQYIRHVLGAVNMRVMEPDYMIAIGCGICAGIKERNEDVKDMLMTDICPFSLGVDVANHQNPRKPLMSFIIERNSSLPVSRENEYVNAYDDQPAMSIKIYQGEAMYAEDNLYLGEISFDIPRMEKGKVHCYVRFTYDINGVLEVEARVPVTNEKKNLVIVNKELGMTAQQVAAKLEEFKKIKVNPAEEEENIYIMEWGERLFIQCSQAQMKEDILRRMQYFQHIMTNDVYQLPKVRKYTTVFLAYVEEVLSHYTDFSEDILEDGGWYEEEDEEGKEIENLFREWDDEK